MMNREEILYEMERLLNLIRADAQKISDYYRQRSERLSAELYQMMMQIQKDAHEEKRSAS